MRSYKRIMPLFLIVALLGAFGFSVKSRIDSNSVYKSALSRARDFAEKRLYVDAMDAYQEAIAEDPSVELYYEAGSVYLNADMLDDAVIWYKEMADLYPEEAKTYLFGVETYYQDDYLRKAFEVYETYLAYGIHSDEVESCVDQFRYDYKTRGTYQDTAPFSNLSGLAAVNYKGNWGFVNKEGSRRVDFKYQEVGPFTTLAPVVDAEGYACYVDENGNERINDTLIAEKDPSFGKAVKFGTYQGSVFWAYNGTEWNAYNMETYEKAFGGYKDVTSFSSGVAAVSNGEKWALISESGSKITDFKYDEVVADGKDTICRNNAIFVRVGETYQLVDATGTAVGSKTFTQVRPFADSTYAAVEMNGKWCFIDSTGNVVLETDYEDAGSFSSGMAAVCKDGLWGYIGMDGSLKIPCTLMGAREFTPEGVAFISEDGEAWTLMMLYYFNENN